MGRNGTSFGVKYQKLLVRWNILSYEEMFVETPIYIRYVVLAIVIFTYMLAIELFYLAQLFSFLGCFFEYLPLFLPLQVCGISLTIIKDFRTFWSCSFVGLLVKGTDNFWKSRGILDGCNESCRQIAPGVEKAADESMSAIWFRTTPKWYLTQYSYIFREPEPLGTYMKNVVCSRLGNMLHLDIQKD